MKVISLVQQKGGSGRSTLATNIAGILSKAHDVTLIDCDLPQGTSASWYAIRQEDNRTGKLKALTADSYTSLINQVHGLKSEYVVLDAPPRVAEVTRAILILSDLILIPLSASAADIWATSDLLDTISEAEKSHKGLITRIVWNRFRSYTKSAQELSVAVKSEIPIKACRSTLGYRVAYSEALARGLTVAEWGDSKARQEIVILTAEIMRLLK